MKAILLLAAMLLQAEPPSRSDVAWMAGHWRDERPRLASGPDVSEEIWAEVAAYGMIGMARTVRGSQLRSFEFIRIQRDDRGRTALHASPGGAPAVRFELASASGQSAVFENRAHDYPQRITYRRNGDTLVATTSLADGSRAESWTYRRHPATR